MSNFYCILNILSIIQKTLRSTYSSYFIRHLLCLSLAHRSSSSFVGFDSKHSLIFKELTGLFWSTWFIQYCCGCPVLVTKCPSMEQSGVSFRSTGIKKFLYLVSSCDEFPCLQGGKNASVLETYCDRMSFIGIPTTLSLGRTKQAQNYRDKKNPGQCLLFRLCLFC